MIESYDSALKYIMKLPNSHYILLNLLVNFGNLYSNTKDVSVFMSGAKYSGATNAYEVGFNVG